MAGLLAAVFLLGAAVSPAFADRGRGRDGDDKHRRGDDRKRVEIRIKKEVRFDKDRKHGKKFEKRVKVKKNVKKFDYKFDRKFDHRRY